MDITPYRLVQTEALLAESPKRDTDFEKKTARNFKKMFPPWIVLIAFLSKNNDIERYLKKIILQSYTSLRHPLHIFTTFVINKKFKYFSISLFLLKNAIKTIHRENIFCEVL